MKRRLIFFLGSRMMYLMALLSRLTQKVRVLGSENLAKARGHHPQGLYALALWHENAMGCLVHYRETPLSAMTSRSRDGDFAAYLLRKHGHSVPRGSTNKGGIDALAAMRADMCSGHCPTLTVDGPKGPRRRAKAGIVKIAADADLAVLPYAVVADRSWVLRRSWDHTRIPKPFARVAKCFGTPIVFDEEARKSPRVLKDTVTRSLNQLEDEAQRFLASWS